MINTLEQAKHYASKQLNHLSLVVSEKGNIYASCDVEKVCSDLEENNEAFFIVKGERKTTTNTHFKEEEDAKTE